MTYRIAIVEDDIDQQQNYADSLQRNGFITTCFSQVEEALEGIKNDRPDLVLLDVVLGNDPKGGFTICEKLLERGENIPIIFLSDRSNEIDQCFGLQLGAWDYQTKPISLALLTERIKNTLRIHHARNSGDQNITPYKNSGLSLDEEKSFAAWYHKTIPLTLTEFRLLIAIVKAGPEGIAYNSLCEKTMQRMVTNGTINSHIKNIRKKFNIIDQTFNCIHNKPGFGYRWEQQ